MAKKVVATLQKGKTDGRGFAKVIKMVKSPKTGAYVFEINVHKNKIKTLHFLKCRVFFGVFSDEMGYFY